MLYAHAVPLTAVRPNSPTCVARGLVAEHSLMHSREKLGFTDFSAEERSALPAACHPLVRTNPRSGRKTLYLASHALRIIGMPVADGRLLLMELIEIATARE